MIEKGGKILLTVKRKRFCDIYLSNGFNGTQACRDAGYSSVAPNGLTKKANKLLNEPDIKAYIKEVLEETDEKLIATKDEILKFLTDTMRGKTKEKTAVTVRTGLGNGVFSDEIKQVDVQVKARERLKSAELLAKIRKYIDGEGDDKTPIIIQNNIPGGPND